MKYAGADISEEIIAIESYDEAIGFAYNKLFSVRTDGEKNFAYVNGLYYEDFYNDNDEAFCINIVKKMKNRITCPVIYLNSSCIQELTEKLNFPIPSVCCGVSYSNELVIINPLTGGYEEITLEKVYLFNGQKK